MLSALHRQIACVLTLWYNMRTVTVFTLCGTWAQPHLCLFPSRPPCALQLGASFIPSLKYGRPEPLPPFPPHKLKLGAFVTPVSTRRPAHSPLLCRFWSWVRPSSMVPMSTCCHWQRRWASPWTQGMTRGQPSTYGMGRTLFSPR